MIDQHLAHQSRRKGVELAAIFKGCVFFFGQPDPGLVNQCRWLQRWLGMLAPEVALGDFAQFGIDRACRGVERCTIALSPLRQQLCYVALRVRHGVYSIPGRALPL